MKIKNIFGGMICLALLASCGDEMDYHVYTNYDKDYVFTNFDNTVGFVTNIYSKLEDGFGPYGKGMLASACDEAEYSWKNGSVQDFTNGAWSALNAKDNWSNNYSAIRAANYFLAHKDECDFSDYKFNKDYAAQMARFERLQYEARYLRAYFYFTAVEKFGDVPFTGTNMPLSTFSIGAIKEDCGFVIDVPFGEGTKLTMDWLKTIDQ